MLSQVRWLLKSAHSHTVATTWYKGLSVLAMVYDGDLPEMFTADDSTTDCTANNECNYQEQIDEDGAAISVRNLYP